MSCVCSSHLCQQTVALAIVNVPTQSVSTKAAEMIAICPSVHLCVEEHILRLPLVEHEIFASAMIMYTSSFDTRARPRLRHPVSFRKFGVGS